MGEYVTYLGRQVKIGTCENLYYVSFQKYQRAYVADMMWRCDGNDYPSEYLKPDSANRFRFPFPDEDRLRFGTIIEPHFRGVPVRIVGKDLDSNEGQSPNKVLDYHIDIVQQRLVHRQADGQLCLALVYRNPKTNKLFRIEDDKDVRYIVRQLVQHHINDEKDPEKKDFYREIARQIFQGYRLQLHPQVLQLIKPSPPGHRPPKPDKPGPRLT